MKDFNDSAAVRAQYGTSANLNARISIHVKYSTNKQGFGPWIASHYDFAPGARVLELGCGTGAMWRGQGERIRRCGRLVLSDFSDGMLAAARETLREFPSIEFRNIDIQDIPFEDGAFDAAIANMMLYHVPDLELGLSEVRRVLRPGGVFYCATYGENGIMRWLCDRFQAYGAEDQTNRNFTLQNGADALRQHFGVVERFDYADALAVTDANDLADYIYSLAGLSALRALPRETVMAALEAERKDGVLRVPKEYGMFIAR